MTSALLSQSLYVLDECALIAFLGREPGATVVDSLLANTNNLCLAHSKGS